MNKEFCTKCGQELKEESEFCTSCGNKFNSENSINEATLKSGKNRRIVKSSATLRVKRLQ